MTKDELVELGLVPVSWENLPSLGAGSKGRECCRVCLESGEVVKVRRVSRAQQARRVQELLHRFPTLGFGAPLHQQGRYLVEPWIRGFSLDGGSHFFEAGRLLASLHRAAPVHRAPTQLLLSESLERIHLLADSGYFENEEVSQLKNLLESENPDEGVKGLTHTDLQPQNLILDTAGVLHCVDNEWVDYGFLEYDLARSFYFWPMEEAEKQQFLKGYEGPGPRRFWSFAAMLRSAEVRCKPGFSGVELPIMRLKAALKEIDRMPETV